MYRLAPEYVSELESAVFSRTNTVYFGESGQLSVRLLNIHGENKGSRLFLRIQMKVGHP